MSCYHPLQGALVVDFDGVVSVRLGEPERGLQALSVLALPCGKCIGCLDSRVAQWALRIEHEALFFSSNCFITLTVADGHIHSIFPGGSLRYPPFQDFIRAFRKRVNNPIRFFMCGEYGAKFGRPHYHAIIFGWHPSADDRILYKTTPMGNLYRSRLLMELWPYGDSTVAYFAPALARYCAGYVLKKVGRRSPKGLAPEFLRVSNKPGLGRKYYDRFKKDMYDGRDKVVLDGGISVKVPRMYDKWLEREAPRHFESIKKAREARYGTHTRAQFDYRFKALPNRERNHLAKRRASLERNLDDGGVQ